MCRCRSRIALGKNLRIVIGPRWMSYGDPWIIWVGQKGNGRKDSRAKKDK